MIQKCIKCGSDMFWLTESNLWEARLSNGVLQCKNKDCDIKEIACYECGKEYNNGEFDNIDINFN
jgi:hypothetical protein